MEENFKEKIYQRLENKKPTASPNVYVDVNNISSDNRLQHIKDIKSNLERNSDESRSLCKKYSRASV